MDLQNALHSESMAAAWDAAYLVDHHVHDAKPLDHNLSLMISEMSGTRPQSERLVLGQTGTPKAIWSMGIVPTQEQTCRTPHDRRYPSHYFIVDKFECTRSLDRAHAMMWHNWTLMLCQHG
jgi:hypothetical protein